MSPAPSVAANLSPTTRKSIGIEALAWTIPINHLADKHQVSRKFVYQQGEKAQQALDAMFAPSKGDVVGIWRISAHDVLTRQGTSVDQELARSTPIFAFTQCIIPDGTAHIQDVLHRFA